MKIIYLTALFLATATLTMAQQKVAQTHGESLPHYTNSHVEKGFVIWSEDFSSGIPATWNNNTVSGPVDWKYTTVGHTGGYATAALNSSSAGDGWIIVDSDADNFSGGGAEDSHLTTDVIDCSGYPNVKLEFQQMFRRWTADITTIRVTTDGGVTFTDFEINQTIDLSGTPNPDYINIDISTAIAGNPANVQIVFWWQGNWDYGWQIDNVAVKEIDSSDVLIKNELYNSVVEYHMTPLNHAMPMDFSTQVENIGLTSQSNVVMTVDVNDGSSSVFSGISNFITSLAPGTTDSVGVSATFTPSTIGIYTVSYTISQDETDLDLSNNIKIGSFEVTDTVYALDNGILSGEWWNQDTQGLGSDPYHIGAAYEINTNDIVTSISVYIGPNTVDGSTIVVELYEHDGVEFPINTVAESDIFDLNSSNIGGWVTVPLTTNYVVTAGTPVMAAVFHTGGTSIVYIGYSTNVAPGYTMSAADPNTAWSGQPRCPMIRLNLANGINEVVENDAHEVSVFPNPVSDQLTVNFGQLNQDAQLTMIDITGKVVYAVQVLSGTNQFQIDVQSIATGIYELTIENGAGISSKKVSVK
ncbi:MAG: T9SS type A sorting domain-containing protein [Flavobacteriales bacterium]|nr:T9SS type A sorting domain-containing protein [Flavobacteriales bacterium]